MKTLTETRKADRAEMADLIRSLAAELGATVEDREPFHANQICMEVRHPGGAYLPLDFDGKSCQPDIHVACWNIRHDSLAKFSRMFGDVNPCHFRKSQFV